MNNKFRNVIAIILGIVIGSVINMFIVMNGSLPDGVTMENLSSSMHLFEAKHFLFPILGHSLGTLVGAFVAAIIAASYEFRIAMVIGVFFLIGGIANIYMLNFPILPAIIDLVIAYLPMSFIAGVVTSSVKQ